MQPAVFVHMVLWNSASTHGYSNLVQVVKSVIRQRGYTLGRKLFFSISDNASQDGGIDSLSAEFSSTAIAFQKFSHNFGFSGAHNIGAYQFLQSAAKYLLVLNPDCRLAEDFIEKLVAALEQHPKCELATPRLLRGDDNLQALQPAELDACGMILTSTLRHFDRGSGELATGAYCETEQVFGGTGACLLISRAAVQALALPELPHTKDALKVHRDLQYLPEQRTDLFDEAFFAYREDADLCWRANSLGLHCLYVADAIGYHRRVVTPERRAQLASELNRHSVRNRFLLQINNYHFCQFAIALLPGIIIRNIVVVVAVLFSERSSIAGLRDLGHLFKRALARRRYIVSKMT